MAVYEDERHSSQWTYSDHQRESSDDEPRRAVYFPSDESFSNMLQGFDENDLLTSFSAKIAAPTAPMPQITEVSGISEAGRFLGKGTFSEVWQCRVLNHQQPVAVKILMQGLDATGSREAELLRNLAHPNLVQLIDVVEGPPSALFLELCEGGTVLDFLYRSPDRASTAFTTQQRLRPALEAANAVSYLHSVEIIHRDVKPSNVFFTDPAWRSANFLPPVKVGDLGLARSIVNDTQKTPCVGTAIYMAPENWGRSNYGKPADVFSLAVLANELATCLRPYADQTAMKRNIAQVMQYIMQGGRPQICNDCTVQEFIIPCWSDDPEERWPAAAIVNYLEAVLQR